jgi:hypothetical protein
MNEGDSYIECDEGESQNCSDQIPKNEWTWDDHKTYFNETGYICIKGNGSKI